MSPLRRSRLAARLERALPIHVQPLDKVRAAFVLLGLVAVVSVLPTLLLAPDATPVERTVAALAVIAVGVRRARGYARGRLTLAGDALEVVAILAVSAVAGAQQSLGLLYTALYLRPLYGSLPAASAGALAGVAAHAFAVATQLGDDGTYSLTSVLQQAPGFVLSIGAMRLLAGALDEQARQERRFRALVRNSTDVITVAGADGRITYQSDAVERLLGRPASRAIGTPLLDEVHPDDADAVWEHFRATVDGQVRDALVCRLRHRDGGWRWVESTASRLLDDPAVAGVVVHSRDVGERKEMEDRLRRMAFHDGLTGLANRALLNDRVTHALAARRRDGGAVAMLLIDLDDFKAVNDSLGHVAGDGVLQTLAGRIAGVTRAEDTVARLGGDEFAIFVERDAAADHVLALAARVLDAVRAPIPSADDAITLGASIGVALGDGEDDGRQLLRHADAAMYIAKQTGGGVEVYRDDRDPRIGDRLTLVAQLRAAIDARALDVLLQPVVDLADGRVVAAEALVRWPHPTRGLLSPDSFLPAAERAGLVGPLTDLVLARALDALAALERDGHVLDVAVNLSPASLDDPELCARVERALRASGLPGRRLAFEVTERTLLVDTDRARGVVDGLAALDVALSIDDFGTGHSSLTRLRELPVAELKIDRSFVADLLHDGDSATIVESTIGLGHGLGMRVVAEGVEDDAVLERLRELGCDRAQGYGILPPRPLDELRTWLSRRPARATRSG